MRDVFHPTRRGKRDLLARKFYFFVCDKMLVFKDEYWKNIALGPQFLCLARKKVF
jgi:hypothetical protein